MAYLGNNHRLTHFLLSAFLPSQPTTSGQGCTCQAFSAVYTASRVLFPPFFVADFKCGYGGYPPYSKRAFCIVILYTPYYLLSDLPV